MKTRSVSALPVSLAHLGPVPPAFEKLRRQLAETSWLCQGTVVCRALKRRVRGRAVQKGPYYLWTCKVQGKTVCVALSHAQYVLLAQAIENQRQLQKTVARMQRLTLNTILKKVPGVTKRK
jgi:hypothetical protein